MKKVICLFGVSNVGKSTIATILERNLRGVHVTPIDKWKRFLENVYELPHKSLNTQEGKRAPVGEVTAGTVLEDSYHFWAERDPSFGAQCLTAQLNELSAIEEETIIVESLRFPEEVRRLKQFATLNDYSLIAFHIKSTKRGKIKSTDKQVGHCITLFPRHSPLVSINNDNRYPTDTANEIEDWIAGFEHNSTNYDAEYIEQMRTSDV